jgi:nucleoside-diphosphate-sugar epimerase
MKIAITGANGFVGSALTTHFADRGHAAIALVRKSAQTPSALPDIRSIDYNDHSVLVSALRDVDVLVHNAGKTKAINHMEMINANVGLTRKVMEAVNALDHPLHLIYISSQAASRPSRLGEPLREDEASQPVTSYGKSKLLAENMIRKHCRKPFTIVRPCSVYGPGDRDFLQLFKLCRQGLSLRIGKLDKQLNMIHVSQLADFLLLLAANPMAYRETFFATDNQVYTQAQIADIICKAMGKKHRQIVIPESLARFVFKSGDLAGRLSGKAGIVNREKLAEVLAEAWLADPAKAKTVLDWEPEPKLEQLIAETYQWYVQASWL